MHGFNETSASSAAVNPLKRKLSEGRPVLGIWSIIPSAMVVEIMSLSGFDFAILDMEHGVFDLGSLEACVRAVEGAGAAPLVRIPGMNSSAAQWALDLGAYGIVVPQLRDARDAEAVVSMAKYAPMGQRGYNPFTRAASYANPADNNSGKLNNEFSLTCVIIESESALADLDAICALPIIDVVYMGIYDLAVALGASGDTRHPRIIEVVEHSVARIRAAGKAAGLMVRNSTEMSRALSLGANFLVFGVDTFLIRQAAVSVVNTLSCEQDKLRKTQTVSQAKKPI